MTPTGVELRFGDQADPLLEQELQLRLRALAEPLGLSLDAVRFGFEAQSLRLWALEAGRVIGCVLFYPESAQRGRLYQMAVDEVFRRRGVGAALVAHLEQALRERGVRQIYLNARGHVVGFYGRLGYRAEGEPFVEVGIEHRRMSREL